LVTIRVEEDAATRWEKFAEQSGRYLSEIVRYLVEQAIKANPKGMTLPWRERS